MRWNRSSIGDICHWVAEIDSHTWLSMMMGMVVSVLLVMIGLEGSSLNTLCHLSCLAGY